MRRAARQAQELGADSALDATLLIAWCDGTTVYVHLYGDGCLAARRADGGMVAIQVSTPETLPITSPICWIGNGWRFIG